MRILFVALMAPSLLVFSTTVRAQVPRWENGAALSELRAADIHSGTRYHDASVENESAVASAAFHGSNDNTASTVYFNDSQPGFAAARDYTVKVSPRGGVYSKVPPVIAPGTSSEGKAWYSKKYAGFKLGKTAGYILTSLTLAAGGAGLGWFMAGGAGAAVGLGLLGLAAGLGLAAIFIGSMGGTYAAKPKRDGFESKISF